MLASAGYASPNWVTFKQAQARGGSVRKGEKSTPVIFWKIDTVEKTDSESGERTRGKRFILRYYNVFNVEQCDGIAVDSETVSHPFEPIERCESVVGSMPKRPMIEHAENRAFYRPSTDRVNMPRPERFTQPAEYYSTLFHELTHATGHVSRLDRKGITELAAFGSSTYSKEELVAEMGAAFLCGHCGIEQSTLENSAAYIGNWLKRLRDDRTLIVFAAAQAQKAADFILDRQAVEMTA
jgi:antirestriction protein ArdC